MKLFISFIVLFLSIYNIDSVCGVLKDITDPLTNFKYADTATGCTYDFLFEYTYMDEATLDLFSVQDEIDSGSFIKFATNGNQSIGLGALVGVRFGIGQYNFTANLVNENNLNIIELIVVVAPVCEAVPPLVSNGNFIGRTYLSSGNIEQYAATYGFDFQLNKSYDGLISVDCAPFTCIVAPFISSYLMIQVGIPFPFNQPPLSTRLLFKFTTIATSAIVNIEVDSLITYPIIQQFTDYYYPQDQAVVAFPGSATITILIPKPFGTVIIPFFYDRLSSTFKITYHKVFETDQNVKYLATRQISQSTSLVTIDILYYQNLTTSRNQAGAEFTLALPYPVFSSNPLLNYGIYNEIQNYMRIEIAGIAFTNAYSWEFQMGTISSSLVIIPKRTIPTPVGISAGTFKSAHVNLNYMVSPYFNTGLSLLNLSPISNLYSTTTDTVAPVISIIRYFPLQNCSLLVQIIASDNLSGLRKFVIFGEHTIYAASSAIGAPVYYNNYIISGTFEAIIESTGRPQVNDLIVAYDNVGNSVIGTTNIPNTMQMPLKKFSCILPSDQYVQLNFFDQYFFKVNPVDLSIQGVDNILYFNFTQPKDINAKVYLSFEFNLNQRFEGAYDHDISMWVVDFHLPINALGAGNLFYTLSIPDITVTSEALATRIVGNKADLYVSSNNITDREGPVITSVSIINDGISFGYRILIADQVNGLKSGEIRVKSTLDTLPYIFNIDVPEGYLIYETDLLIPLTDYPICSGPITFQIVYARLVDRGNHVTIFDMGVSEIDGVPAINPFYTITAPLPDNILTCNNIVADSTAPFFAPINDPVYNVVDVGQENRFWMYKFNGTDNNLISKRHFPYCRIYTLYDEIYVKANMTFNGNTFNGSCSTNLPYGWAQGNSLGVFRVSVYGVVDVLLNIGGFDKVDQIFTATLNYSTIMIDDYYPVSSRGGSLTIKGHRFGLVSTTDARVNITKGTKFQLYQPSFVSGSMIIIDNLPPTSNSYLASVVINNVVSNQITIIPTTPRQSPFATSPPPTIPTPPPSCPGTPPCSGPTHGSCTSKGCECISPYRGNDCSSQTVPGGPPETGGNDPTTNSTTEIPTEDGGSITIISLISVISLNELNFKGESVKNHSLSNWKLDNTSAVVGDVIATYSLTIDNDPIVKTNISVTIQYFKNETIIEFADQELKMYPSSLKYSIDIGEYKFAQSLNTLQLIMSVEISTSDDEIGSCINQEIGNTTESDSEFYKLQINDHSLYGRFIKRGIVDNNIRALSSTIQTSIDDNSKSNSIQSLIAINIPHYSESVLIDPDFSILLDSQPAQDKDDSICTAKSDKGLSKSQLAGIIIGCVAFAGIVIVSAVYLLHKRKQSQSFRDKIKMAGKNIN
ncbi:EGF-like domain-containing protein [Tieghemostelium lacteum]|uniref:EGF-like domain-containing protein n=1 Tax=Tieghemostelium lacteum TaxID=361077 RepID=A0A151ZEU0_TIELA|nr:EGF-like domain-containing protein [Tieghemostelium lacteum]|eukprot:KYQ92429.1 EGF-like domain-containing protein [Tieghemostelium lacteum]